MFHRRIAAPAAALALTALTALVAPAAFAQPVATPTSNSPRSRVEYPQTQTVDQVDDYHGTPALLDSVVLRPFDDAPAMLNALQSGQIDIINQMPVLAGVALLNDPNFEIISLKSSAHQQLHMHCDEGPTKDARVRRAIALCLDREKLAAGLMKGRSALGNDSLKVELQLLDKAGSPVNVKGFPSGARKLDGCGGSVIIG